MKQVIQRKILHIATSFKNKYPELHYATPLVKPTMAIKDIALSAKTNLVSVLEDIGECHTSFYPQNMEALNQSTGYIFIELS